MIYTYTFRILKGFYPFHIIRSYSAAEDERRIAVITIQHIPIELVAATSYHLTLSIEKEEFYMSFIFLIFLDIICRRYAYILYKLYTFMYVRIYCSTQIVNHCHSLFAMQLDVIQIIIIYPRNDVLRHVIHKNAHFLKIRLRLG